MWLTVRITRELAPQPNSDVSSINQEPEQRMRPPPLEATSRPAPPQLAEIDKRKSHRRIETSSSSSDLHSPHGNTTLQPDHQQPGGTDERPIIVGSSPPPVIPLRSALHKEGVGSSSRVHPGAKKITKRSNRANGRTSNQQAQGLTVVHPQARPKPLSIAGSETEPLASGLRKKPEVKKPPIANQSAQPGALQAPPPLNSRSTRQIRSPTPFSRRSLSVDSHSSSDSETLSSPEPDSFLEPHALQEPTPLQELDTPPEPSAGEMCDPTAAIDQNAVNNDLTQAIQDLGGDAISDMVS